jgi:AcrR family transcriptional regulator
MTTITRKQREIHQREVQILDVARRILNTDGYIRLNMDRIAEEIEYAKGTVYQHFSSKEDIIVALNIVMHEKMEELFQQAASFQAASRQCMTAVGVASNLMNRLYPDHQHIERITGNPAILEKARPERRERIQKLEGACIGVLSEIVQRGVTGGDLQLPTGVHPEDLVFGLWAMSSGGYDIIASGIDLIDSGVPDPMGALWLNFSMLMDGYGWKPLSHEDDWRETRHRAWNELFAADYSDFAPTWLRSDAE